MEAQSVAAVGQKPPAARRMAASNSSHTAFDSYRVAAMPVLGDAHRAYIKRGKCASTRNGFVYITGRYQSVGRPACGMVTIVIA
jgi:hypothetical protein